MGNTFGGQYPSIEPPSLDSSTLGSGGSGDAASQALLQALAQIQQAQQQPLIPNNPIAQMGVALQGYASGYQGRQNPAIEQALAMRQQQMSGFGHQAQIANSLATLQETQRLRKTQEQSEARKDLLDRIKTKEKFAEDMIKSESYDMRLQGYKLKQTLPSEYGGLPPNADPEKLARFTKSEMETAHDSAIDLIYAGENPRDPKWRGKFDHVPVEEYAQTIAANPAAGAVLYKKQSTAKDFMQEKSMLFRSLPPEQRTPTIERFLAAVGEDAKVSYGVEFNDAAQALSHTDPTFGPYVPNKPSPEQAAKTYAQMQRSKPNSIERLTQQVEDAPDAATKVKLQKQLDTLITNKAKAAGAVTEATLEKKPLDDKTQGDMRSYDQTIAAINEFKSKVTDENMKKFTGITRNPTQQAKLFVSDLAGSVPIIGGPLQRIVGPVDTDFAEYQALMGRMKKGVFDLGGKQLTQFEASVAFQTIPTGSEKGGAAEMQKKLEYLEKFTKVSRDLTLKLATTGRSKLSEPGAYDAMLTQAMANAGLRVPNARDKTPWNEPQSVPGYRRPGESQ